MTSSVWDTHNLVWYHHGFATNIWLEMAAILDGLLSLLWGLSPVFSVFRFSNCYADFSQIWVRFQWVVLNSTCIKKVFKDHTHFCPSGLILLRFCIYIKTTCLSVCPSIKVSFSQMRLSFRYLNHAKPVLYLDCIAKTTTSVQFIRFFKFLAAALIVFKSVEPPRHS